MKKAYELVDGSWSTDYEVGDEFIVEFSRGIFTPPSFVELFEDDGSKYPKFKLIKGWCGFNNAKGAPGAFYPWGWLTPTTETKRKALTRKRLFPFYQIARKASPDTAGRMSVEREEVKLESDLIP
jgi:hypothetical protein